MPCYVIHGKLIDELGNGYGLQLDYQIPIEATDRKQRSRFKSWGSTKLYRVMYTDDLCACFTSVDAARRGFKIIENEFKRYGLILSRPKTESMTLNHDDETTKSESLIFLDEEKIKNVLEHASTEVLRTL